MLSFDKIVTKLMKKWWKVIFKSDIYELIDPERKPEYQSRVDKVVYRLRADGVIVPLKSWVYIIPASEDADLNKIDLVEKYYMILLKKIITQETGSSYFISWNKALELHLKDESVPEKIYVTTRNINKKVLVGDYTIIFKTVSAKIDGKKKNLYSKLSSYIQYKKIDGVDLKVSSIELALVESALISDNEEWCDVALLNRAIKKYGNIMNPEVFYELGRYKYCMSFNRLKTVAKTIHPSLYNIFLDIIKKNGGLFIGESLRRI